MAREQFFKQFKEEKKICLDRFSISAVEKAGTIGVAKKDPNFQRLVVNWENGNMSFLLYDDKDSFHIVESEEKEKLINKIAKIWAESDVCPFSPEDRIFSDKECKECDCTHCCKRYILDRLNGASEKEAILNLPFVKGLV